MTVTYAVTFEFDTRPPLTYRGTVEAGQPSTCASRAIRIAQQALKPKSWTSMNCVLLERLDRELRVDDPLQEPAA